MHWSMSCGMFCGASPVREFQKVVIEDLFPSLQIFQTEKENEMKKYALLVAFSLTFMMSPLLQAQTDMSAGPVVGLNINEHTGSDLPKNVTGYGAIVGLQYDAEFTQSLGLRVSATYDNRIGTYSEAGLDASTGLDYTLDRVVTIAYVTVEPLFKYTIPYRPIFFVLGPSIGINAGSKSEATTTITTPGYTFSNGYSTETVTADIQNVNVRFELKAGVGYFIRFDKITRVSFQATYGYGLTNIVKDSDWRVRTFSLRASLDIGFGR